MFIIFYVFFISTDLKADELITESNLTSFGISMLAFPTSQPLSLALDDSYQDDDFPPKKPFIQYHVKSIFDFDGYNIDNLQIILSLQYYLEKISNLFKGEYNEISLYDVPEQSADENTTTTESTNNLVFISLPLFGKGKNPSPSESSDDNHSLHGEKREDSKSPDKTNEEVPNNPGNGDDLPPIDQLIEALFSNNHLADLIEKIYRKLPTDFDRAIMLVNIMSECTLELEAGEPTGSPLYDFGYVARCIAANKNSTIIFFILVAQSYPDLLIFEGLPIDISTLATFGFPENSGNSSPSMRNLNMALQLIVKIFETDRSILNMDPDDLHECISLFGSWSQSVVCRDRIVRLVGKLLFRFRNNILFLRLLSKNHPSEYSSDIESSRTIIELADSLSNSFTACSRRHLEHNRNYAEASEIIPESLVGVELIYINCTINGKTVKALIDTGAAKSIISNNMIRYLQITQNVDTRLEGIAQGIGHCRILGRIHSVEITFADCVCFYAGFTVTENDMNHIIIGMDIIQTQGINILTTESVLEIPSINLRIPFKKK